MRSPCRGIKLPPAEFAEPRFVSLDELHQIADGMSPKWGTSHTFSALRSCAAVVARLGLVAHVLLGPIPRT